MDVRMPEMDGLLEELIGQRDETERGLKDE